ncbi:MAG: transporter [Saprospiraceae bacterium]|nr:transporter [Saprospiraceae bacterium]MCF8250882.1 transporter [Saprospiraceae bacterium]MCF8281138.1 hypothetical protein [Bacteroidales bacterium]MCF8312717.1 transporter [Saprospiraceae bacterium]MCF8441164.1 transporter [Saprospiraceae bacterium]
MMKSSFTFALLLILGAVFTTENLLAQGCVAIRNMGCSGTTIGGSNSGFLQKGQFQLTGNYRYFKSFRHFRGSHEEAERVERNTEVINKTHSLDLGLGYGITNRFSVSLTLPINHYDRSSLYEHYGNPKFDADGNPANPLGWSHSRFHTGSKGIGDLRLTGNYWLIDPAKGGRGNLSIGLGVKAPTGNAEVKDDFHKLTKTGQDTIINKYADQSIQLGDGGWGFSMEMQGYYSFVPRLSAYFSGFYMATPQEHNGVARQAIATEYPKSILNYFAVPDQFAARAGFGFALLPKAGLAANLGGRVEGVASEDLIGGKGGYRRPGYVVSVEPGIDWFYGNYSFALNLPVAVYRNRTKSVSDKANDSHGDAAFADYLISLSATYRFGGKHDMMPETGGVFKDVPAPKH